MNCARNCIDSVRRHCARHVSLKAFADSRVVLEAQRAQAKCSVCQEFYGNGWMGGRGILNDSTMIFIGLWERALEDQGSVFLRFDLSMVLLGSLVVFLIS